MNIATRIAAATLVAASLGTAAAAEEWTGPRVVGTGENGSVEYPTPSTNIVGGALTRQVGSGEGASIEVLSVQHATIGRPGRQVGSGESAQTLLPGDRG